MTGTTATRVALSVDEKESDDNNSSVGVVNVFCDNGDWETSCINNLNGICKMKCITLACFSLFFVKKMF